MPFNQIAKPVMKKSSNCKGKPKRKMRNFSNNEKISSIKMTRYSRWGKKQICTRADVQIYKEISSFHLALWTNFLMIQEVWVTNCSYIKTESNNLKTILPELGKKRQIKTMKYEDSQEKRTRWRKNSKSCRVRAFATRERPKAQVQQSIASRHRWTAPRATWSSWWFKKVSFKRL